MFQLIFHGQEGPLSTYKACATESDRKASIAIAQCDGMFLRNGIYLCAVQNATIIIRFESCVAQP